MEFKTMSLRECALADCPINERPALIEKYRKRSRVKQMSRHGNTSRRDERSKAANVAPTRTK